MEHLAYTIAQPETVLVFVSIILLVALRPLYQSLVTIRAVNHDLDAATALLTALGKQQQDAFYAQFKTLNTALLCIPGLRHAWREFADSMYVESAASPSAHKKVYLSHRPAHYFNRTSVLGTRLNLSQFLAYPNYLIGIGLTFTFIGLAAALHVAQAGLASGAGQQALKDLLAVASVKFISSIVGITGSLVISALQRHRLRIFQQKLDAFCDLLEECTKYKSAEKLLHDMPGAIATSLGASIGSQLSAGVAQALEPLAQDIRALAQQFAQSSEAALRGMADEFLRALRSSSATDMQALMENIRSISTTLGTLSTQMQSAGTTLDTGIQASTHRLTDTLEQCTGPLASMQQSIAQFTQSMQVLGALAGGMQHTGEMLRATAADHQTTAASFGKAMQDATRTVNGLSELQAGLAQSLHNADTASANFKSAGGAITHAADAFKHSAMLFGQAETAMQQRTSALAQSAQSIAASIPHLERTAQQITRAASLAKQHEGGYFAALKAKWRK